MSFDDEIDGRIQKLESEGATDDAPLEDEADLSDLEALEALIPLLEEKISSRRLEFEVTEDDDDDEVGIDVVHTQTEEAIGFIFAQDGIYAFVANVDDFFEDFSETSAEMFVVKLAEVLKKGLPGYELDQD